MTIHVHSLVNTIFVYVDGDLGKAVSVKVTTSNVRIKLVDDGTILYDFPVLRISYVGLDERHKQAVSFVAKEGEVSSNVLLTI